MARKILNRKDLRAASDAAERRKEDETKAETEEEEEEEGDDEEGEDEEGGDEEEGAVDDEAEGEEAEEDEDGEIKPKKKKKVAVVKAKAKPRSRTAKIVRLRMVWGVFNNSNQCVKTFDYPRRKEADDLATQLTADKRQTHFVQPVKEPIEEKKEKEK